MNLDDEDPYTIGAMLLSGDFLNDEPPTEPAVDGMSLDDVGRLLRQHARMSRTAQAIRERYAVERARLDAWRDDRVGAVDREVERLETACGQWLAAHRARQRAAGVPNAKLPASVSTPFGSVRSTKGSTTTRIVDEGAVVAWAKQHHPDAVEVVEKVTVSTLKALDSVRSAADHPGHDIGDPVATSLVDTTTGEWVPGVEVEHKPRSYRVETPR